MNNLCFHSILSSNQEVDFFTDMLLDTGIAGDLDHSLLAELEVIPEQAIFDEQAEAIAEQWDIEIAIEVQEIEKLDLPKDMLPYELHYTCGIRNEMFQIAQQVARGIEY